ncbi:MAG: hypothetical protein ACI4K9_08145 [Candidatus Fimenecus sp.]
MKQKKRLIPILVLVLLVQLLAPVGLIIYHNSLNRDIQTQGDIYRIEIEIHSINAGTVYYSPINFYIGYSEKPGTAYCTIHTNENGISGLDTPTAKKPSGDTPYIRCVNPNTFPYHCVYETGIQSLSYTDRKIDPTRTDLYAPSLIAQQAAFAEKDWYLELAVYRGNYTVLGIVDENGVPCEQVLQQIL